MQNIVICGDVGERELTETIIKLCEMNGGAIVSDRGRVYETNENPRFFIVTDMEKVNCKSIVVLGEEVGDVEIENEFAVIVEGENTRGLEILKKQGCQNVLTCSMNGRATLSMSSVYPKKVMSLQRSIQTLDGKIIEPCEFKMDCDAEELYPVLAVGGIMILSGFMAGD